MVRRGKVYNTMELSFELTIASQHIPTWISKTQLVFIIFLLHAAQPASQLMMDGSIGRKVGGNHIVLQSTCRAG
jgi:hypothetical protein